MNLLISSLLCLHLLAAALWVGGMATMHFAVRPAAVATLEPPLRLPLMAAALGRFLGWVGGAIVLLLLTGFAMVGMAGGFARVHWSVHAMLALGLVMMAMYGHIRFAGYPKLARFAASRDWSAAGQALATIRMLVAINLALGVLVFVIAVVGRVL
ncbi:CopD family protein [soil metagenome]